MIAKNKIRLAVGLVLLFVAIYLAISSVKTEPVRPLPPTNVRVE